MRHANILRQERALMQLRQMTDWPVTSSADISDDDSCDSVGQIVEERPEF